MSGNPTKGYLYVVCGSQPYYDEACWSIKSLLDIHPGARIACVCDRPTGFPKPIRDLLEPLIERPMAKAGEASMAHQGWQYKLSALYQASPFEHTVFLDSDTYIVAPLDCLFHALELYDLCAAVGAVDRSLTAIGAHQTEDLATLNSGVIAFRKTQAVECIFASASRAYCSHPERFSGDQHALSLALADHPIRFLPLPNNYNARFPFPEVYTGRVHVLHGRHPSPTAIAKAINSELVTRIWLPWMEICLPAGPSSKFSLRMLAISLKSRFGLLGKTS